MSSLNLESKMNEEKTKLPENETLWELSQNVEENEDYLQLRNTLLNKIKICHDILRNNESICGTKARDDIMRILCLIMLKHKFVNEDDELMNKCKKLKNDENNILSVEEYETYMTYCRDTEKLPKSGDVLDNWRLLVNEFLKKIFNTIYFEDDETFNFQNENTFIQLFECLNSSVIDDKFIDSFETSCGDIHEMFLAYGDKAVAKELGQYFTPRHLIHLIFHGIKAPNIKSPKIYDPCAGTCGFLTRIFKLHKMKTRHIYGCEIEKDTIKFGQLSLILNTKSIKNNLVNCNSLCQNPFIFTKKFDYIYTNPPFGTKMKYKDLKMKFTKYKDENYPDVDIHFEDVYPINKNDGTCLFIQHCVYVLSEGGFCAIVLPDGQLFNSKNFKKFREWLCDNVNILTIVKVPSGVFEHTNIKTNVLCFQKDGKTNNINFVKTNKKCNILQTIFNVSNVELKENGFSFDENEYIIESKIKYSAPVVKLGDVCDFMKKSKRQASYGKETGKYPFYTSSQICKKYVNEFDYENKCVIIGTGGTANIKMDENFSCSTDNFILKINNTSSVEYLFLYLKYNLKLLENGFKGVGLKHISKEYLKKIKIPLPILEIQNEIIEELSKLETSIQTLELRNEQLKNEKEQFRKYGLFEKINELLHGAEIKTIGDVMETKGGKGEYDRKQIKNGDYIYPYYDSNGIKGYVKNYLYENVNIITARNLSIGAVYLVNIKYYPSDHTINFTSKNKNTMLNVFFYNWLLFNNNKLIALSHGIKPGIRMSDVRKLNMPVPTLKKQEKLIALYEKKERNINKINDKIELNNKHIIKLKELGKNIIISFCN
jgi:type I restriction-modification system DNA methylase subunit